MHVLAFRLALSHLLQKPLSRLVVIVSVACILLMNAMVFLLFQSFSRSLAEVRSSQFMTAYIDSAVKPEGEAEVVSAVRKIPGVASAQLVSKDAFIDNFAKYFPQLSTDLTSLDADTIPRFVKIKASRGLSGNVQSQVERIKGVELVELNKNRYAGLLAALSTLRKLALGLIAGMSIALLCVLLNHFKLRSGFQSQVRQTLKMLGGKSGQVLLPFAIEGLVEGALGGGLAAALLLGYGKLFEAELGSFFTAIGYHPYHFEMTGLACALALVGTGAGMTGSLWAALRAKA